MSNYSKRHPCVRCGYCCGAEKNEASWCAFGADGENNRCKYLIKDDPILRTYKCSQFKEISEIELTSSYPMFGCGCSSPLFNGVRDKVIHNLSIS